MFELERQPFRMLREWVRYYEKHPPKKRKEGKNGKERVSVAVEN